MTNTASEIVHAICSGKITAVAVVKSYLERIRQKESMVKAWAFLDEEYAFDQARAVDEGFLSGKPCGRLCGVPIGIKDVFNTKVLPTEMGSPIWKGHKAGNDARVVEQIKWEGGIVIGKTVTAEFAVHHPGPTANPHNIEHTPGTSSSGSAAAVASLMVPVALGTQTAGSLIRPASYCGIYAMKPTFGFIPRTGVLKTMETLDQIGFYARSVIDLKLLFELTRIGGRDHPMKEDRLSRDVERTTWKIGVITGHIFENALEYARKAFLDFAKNLENSYFVVEDVDLPDGFNNAHNVHSQIYNSDLGYYFKDEYNNRPYLISDVLVNLIQLGLSYPPEDYCLALEEQREMIHKLDVLFDKYDILLSLSSLGEAPKVEKREIDYCSIWTMCHVPVVNVPLFSGPNNLPFGLQVVAKRYNDLILLKFIDELDKQGMAPPLKVGGV